MATVWIQVADVVRVEAAELLLRHRVSFKHLYWMAEPEQSVWSITDERLPPAWEGQEVRLKAKLPSDEYDDECGVDAITIELASKPPPPTPCLRIMGMDVCFFCRKTPSADGVCPGHQPAASVVAAKFA